MTRLGIIAALLAAAGILAMPRPALADSPGPAPAARGERAIRLPPDRGPKAAKERKMKWDDLAFGKYTADNMVVVPAREQVAAAADIHRQIKAIPDGAKVEIKVGD